MKKIPYGKQTISNKDSKNILKSLRSDYLTTGPMTEIFEKKFSKKVGSKYSISCSSGTSALHLCFMSINLKPGDIIILPVINFIASVNMSYLMGAKIYFADVDKKNGQMTPSSLEKCIKVYKIKKIKAVVTMYNGGSPNNAKEFYNLKKIYNFFLIEDACHALGGKYDVTNKNNVGSCKYSDLSTFSLHPVKSITTGEGGVITTNNSKIKSKLLILRNHGILRKKNKNNIYNWKYKIILPGFNYRLSDIACSLGLSQLNQLDKFISKRLLISNLYNKKLKELDQYIELPEKIKGQLSANHLFIINLSGQKRGINRDLLIQKLYKKNIITQVHYLPIFKHPFYKKICKGNFPGANHYYSNCLSLPIFPELKLKQIDYICSTLAQIFKSN
jgi:dTDP-4-amino-4,6-dideoxygalactose transaminase|tara:strand:- start:4290 stop:5453 length:1164 start_codon:yes stop_codon:yes gene_type:complete